jgi:alkanesulfonate monooxygenase SsuD/methylene tetrahydromethanopterin reductase-like flavin-dependent oxidoreductase (luciferase family)
MTGVTTVTGIGAAIEQTNVSLAEAYQRARLAEQAGVDSLWLIQMPNQRENMMVLSGLAANTKTVSLGPSIVPMYTRPPVVMAQTAMTLDEISGGRLILGLGLGNPIAGQWMLGGAPAPPLQSTREYLTIVTSLIKTGEVSFTGRWHSGNATYAGPRRADLPVYLGTFGPRMLELAGELADGVILWLCTADYVRETVMPSLRAGWARRPAPPRDFPVTLMLSASVTGDEYERENFRRALGAYCRVPAYRQMFEASGFTAEVKAGRASDDMVDGLSAMGTREHLRDRLAAYTGAGVTRFAIGPQIGKEFDPERYTDTLNAAISAFTPA